MVELLTEIPTVGFMSLSFIVISTEDAEVSVLPNLMVSIVNVSIPILRVSSDSAISVSSLGYTYFTPDVDPAGTIIVLSSLPSDSLL